MLPEIARKVGALFQQTGPPVRIDQSLTPQEVRLLGLLSDGYQSAALRLNISANTVRDYHSQSMKNCMSTPNPRPLASHCEVESSSDAIIF
jgi:DNA-binding NarL/FixJ family response regulator